MAIHQGLMVKMKTRIQNIDIHPVLSMTIKDVRSTVESYGGVMLKKLMRFLPWFLIPSFLNGSEFLQEQKWPNICFWNLKPNRKHEITNVIFAPIVRSGSTAFHTFQVVTDHIKEEMCNHYSCGCGSTQSLSGHTKQRPTESEGISLPLALSLNARADHTIVPPVYIEVGRRNVRR